MKKLLITCVLSAGLLAGCASQTEPSDAFKGETPEHIFDVGKKAMQGHNYGDAVKRFEALDVQYPFGKNTEEAQLYIIYAYYMKEDYTLAAAAADRFIRIHPDNPHVDYAYYMRGLSDYYENLGFIERIFSIDLATRDLTQIEKSYRDFSALVARFPNSRYTPAAHQYLIYLRNLLANHQLEVATFYYKHRAYVASANRASDVVAHYEGSTAVKDALILLIKSYRELHATKLEQDARRVFAHNYPGEVVEE